MKKITSLLIAMLFLSFIPFQVNAQSIDKENKEAALFAGFKFRNIGPALMSGRIADIAIHPEDENIWYVAVGSGGVWKTENAGTTWKPIFDDQPVYSIGCVTIDPNNPHTIWVGTGENVGGRHVGFGDGVYKSDDGGCTWKNMGLKQSEHISKIIVHPTNPDIIWVAAQGPLWSKGGERGLYKSTDGGKNWKKTLGDNEWTGVTDLVIDPRNPNRLYAATWQHHRNVAAYMGGGPKSGIYRSIDGGENWEGLSKGLPKSKMGKIGLAISPQQPDVLYAAIELNRTKGGVFKSTDRGSSWEKQSNAVSGATGPHYYQELYASPHAFDRIYLADVRMQVSDDGGKTFRRMKEENKHSDNHALAFKKSDPNYLLAGTDGGLYESFDLEKTWRFIDNLPVTQFYKLALDDSEPFYNIYGGTQDNNTQMGPSRTDHVHGITNADWRVVLFADGHQPATEPGNPEIAYAEWQQGNLVRLDRTTGEVVYIQPQPAEGEDYERFNWDAPILVSPHDPTRLYYASQRVWRSDNRGDSWTAISEDLTRNQERMTLPIMDEVQSWDSPWDFNAMSNYNTITSLAESPVKEGVIYAGTDDGIVQVTEDGGANWRKIEVGEMPGVPETAFVNDIKADLYDENTVYMALDNHKFGDFKPYLLKSTDKGKSWKSITGNLPGKLLVWRLVQDHVKSDLLFAATEFGIYFTPDGGTKWIKLKGNVPTISFRDIAIHKRENDLVGASFGRGFFVLDDYTALREVSTEMLNQDAKLFTPRKAWWYKEKPMFGFSEKSSQGHAFFTAPNPPFGALFTYYLKNDLKSREKVRQEKEQALEKENKQLVFPGWDALEEEMREREPAIWLVISDNEGNVIRRLKTKGKKGFHRIAWDLRYPSKRPVPAEKYDESEQSESREPEGVMVEPGTYTANLYMQRDDAITLLAGPVSFEVERLFEGALEGSSDDRVVEFWKETAQVQAELSEFVMELENTMETTAAMYKAAKRSLEAPGDLDRKIYNLHQQLMDIEQKLRGRKAKNAIGEKDNPTVYKRLSVAVSGTENSTYGPAPMHEESLQLARKKLMELKQEFELIKNKELPAVKQMLEQSGAPYVEGL